MRVAPALVVLALAALTGCIDYDEVLTLNEDGSGSLKIDQAIDLSFDEEIRKLHGPTGEGEDSGIQLPKKEELEKSLSVPGITLKSVEVESKGSKGRVKVELEFKDLASLREIEGFSDRKLELEEAPGDKVIVRYVLDGKKMFGMPTEGKNDPPPWKEGDETAKKTAQILRDARDKARLKVTLRLPGKVLETTGKPVEGDEKAVTLLATAKPDSKPRLGTGEDLPLSATVAKGALEKALAREKAAKAERAKAKPPAPEPKKKE